MFVTLCSSTNFSCPRPLALWETSYAAIERSSIISIKDRCALAAGICHVLASLPDDHRIKSFEGMASQPVGLLERLSSTAKDSYTAPSNLSQTLPRIGAEILILSTMARSFATALGSGDSDAMESGCDTSPDRLTPIPEPVLQIIHGAWSNITFAAANWVDDEVRVPVFDSYPAFSVFSLSPNSPFRRPSLLRLQNCFPICCRLCVMMQRA